MPALSQDWLAAALAMVAAAWLLRRAWRRRRRAGTACAGCEHCPMAAGRPADGLSSPASAIPSFVPLDSLRRSTGAGVPAARR